MKSALALLCVLGGIAHADVTITPSVAKADSPGLAIAVTPVLPGARHLLAADGSDAAAYEADEDGYGWVPLLPYGTVYLAITNKTALPIVVAPEELTLLVRGVRYRALGTTAEIEKRWRKFADLERLARDDARQLAHDRLALMRGPVTIAPRSVLRGYVVFDYKGVLASDYESFLRDAQQVFVVLQSRAEKLTATFLVR